LLDPFLPFSSEKVRKILRIEQTAWQHIKIPAGLTLGPVEILFERIDKSVIQEEEQRLEKIKTK
jgi:methionyl-tRNA synthetase